MEVLLHSRKEPEIAWCEIWTTKRMWHIFNNEFDKLLLNRSSDVRMTIIVMSCPIPHQFVIFVDMRYHKILKSEAEYSLFNELFGKSNMLTNFIFLCIKNNKHNLISRFRLLDFFVDGRISCEQIKKMYNNIFNKLSLCTLIKSFNSKTVKK